VSEATPARGAIVLAGGKSTRMGRDKASLPFGDGTMLSRVVRVLADVVTEIVLVARRGQALPEVGLLPERVSLVSAYDEVESKGPLAGLAAGLASLSAPIAYASSCDVPFLSPAFVEFLLGVLEAREDVAVAIPRAEGHLHPLAAAYRRDAVLPVVRELLAVDRLRPVFLLERLPHVIVNEADLRRVDPGLDALANLNDPDAYREAVERLNARR
jgi:molybdopterin-guanine dinucleotide biosynthesis protein A